MFLLDTNVLTESSRLRPNARVLTWCGQHPAASASVLSLYEIELGIELTTGRRRDDLRAWLNLLESSGLSFLPVTDAVARQAGLWMARDRKVGVTRSTIDLLIAATAAVHSAALVTRNVPDFDGLGLKLVNPFD